MYVVEHYGHAMAWGFGEANISGDYSLKYLSAEKAHRVMKWQPQFTLEQGLDETVAWYREYLATENKR